MLGWLRWYFSPSSTFAAFDRGGTSILAGSAVRPPTTEFCSTSFTKCHAAVLLSFTLTGVVSQALKVTVGRPRPDLIARCLPKPGSENAAVFGLVTAEICTQTDFFILKDGFRSFPSAHASCTSTPRSTRSQCSDVRFALVSFAGLGFLSFYLAGKTHLFVRLSRPSFHSTTQSNFTLAGRTRPHLQGFGSSHTPYRRSSHRRLAHDGL